MGGNFHTIFTRSLSDGEIPESWELGTGREYMDGEAMKERVRGIGVGRMANGCQKKTREATGGLYARHSTIKANFNLTKPVESAILNEKE